MGYRFLKDISRSDVAVRVTSATLSGLISQAGAAFNRIIIMKPGLLPSDNIKKFSIYFKTEEELMFKFLNKLVYYKDVNNLLFRRFRATKTKGHMVIEARGGRIDPEKIKPVVDIKAVTMHKFSVARKKGEWSMTAVFDV